MRVDVWWLAVAMCVVLALPAAAQAKRAVKVKPDLSVASVSVTGSNTPGASLSVTSTVRSSKAAAKASQTVFLLSRDGVRSKGDLQLGAAKTAGITSGASTKAVGKVTLPLGFTGAFYLLACADGAGVIGEASEKNNCKASARRVMSAAGGSGATPGPSTGTPAPNGGTTTITNGGGTTPAPAADPLPELNMGVTRAAVEGNAGSAHSLEYDIALSSATTHAVSVAWSTSSIGTAQSTDFIASAGTATIPAGQTLTTVYVPVVGDTNAEDDESVRVVITSPTGATIGTSRADAMIFDDEAATVSAAAASQTAVELTFSAAPTNLASDGSQFAISGLSVTAASLVGKVVTLTTTAQLANQEYTVTLDTALRANARLVAASGNFIGTGPIARLEITEVNANIAGNADLVELRAVTGGSLAGAIIDQAPFTPGGAQVGLPAIGVLQGDYVLVHYGSPADVTTETVGKTECGLGGCSSAWDVNANPTLTLSSKLLTVVDYNGNVTDGVPFRQSTATSSDATLQANLSGLQDHALWATCTPGPHCVSGPEYDSVAVDWSGTDTTAAGQSMRRIGADTNQPGNWMLGASSWGAANS